MTPKARFGRAELESYRDTEVPDLVGPGLRLLFVGINPGLWTAATGAHFARPGNRFFPALAAAGIIERPIDPSCGLSAYDRDYMIARGVGITNLVARATAKADELTTDELVMGARGLRDTVRHLAPVVVAIAGITAYRTGFGVKSAKVGRQPNDLEGAALWDLGHAARTTSSAACVDPRDRDTDDDGIPDRRGLELVRSPKSTEDVYARSDRRVGVTEGQQLSLLADVRSASPGSELEIRWYSGFSGKSVGTTSVSVPATEAGPAECTQVRIDAAVPPGVVAAQPYVRLRPPDNSLTGPRLAVDDVRLVAWSPDGAAGRRFDTVERTRPGVVRVSTDKMEGEGPLVGNGNGTVSR